MVVGKKITFNMHHGVDEAILEIAKEIENGYTVRSISRVQEQDIFSICRNEEWEVELKRIEAEKEGF